MIDALTIEQHNALLQKAYEKLSHALDCENCDLITVLSKAISELLDSRDRHYMTAPPKLGNAFMGTRSAPAPAPAPPMTAADRKLQRALNAPCMGMDDDE